MAYTLLQLLTSGGVPNAKRLTPDQDFSQIPVRSVSVQELPVEDFIRPGELVLSTAAGCREDPARLYDLVRQVGSAHAAALFLSFREPFSLPRGVIDAASSMALPLFEIPWGLRFSDIVETVSREIEASRTAIFRRLQSDLLNAYYEGRTLEDASRLIASALHTDVFLTDASGAVIARSDRRSALPDADMLAFPIETGRTKSGSLLLRKKTRQPILLLEEEPDLAPRFLGFPLSLWYNRQDIEEQTRIRLKNDFVRELTDASAMDPDERRRQAALLGVRLDVPYTCVVLRFRPAPDPDFPLTETVERVLQETADAKNVPILLSVRLSDTVLYVETRPGGGPDIDALLDAFESALRESRPDLTCCWGIRASRQDPPDLPALYHDAASAAALAVTARGGRSRFRWTDTQEAKIAAWLSENAEIRENAERTVIRPLRDAARGSDVLIETLVQYIASGGNAAAAARALPVHRQTLLYRLRRIEQATGLSLSSCRDRFLLEIATRMFCTYPI